MSRLSKRQANLHKEACELLKKDLLTFDEREFVFANWQESATHINNLAGAFFTPPDLAYAFAASLGTGGGRIIDLCAGIGVLSFMCHLRTPLMDVRPEIICIEANTDYAEVGRKIFPEAKWICADVFDVPHMDLGHFDFAIANPPFGSIDRHGRNAPLFNGQDFEYHVIDIASGIADFGFFIIPQASAPFEVSGRDYYRATRSDKYEKFQRKTGIPLMMNSSIDTSYFKKEWRKVSPIVEIVDANFIEAREGRSSFSQKEAA